MRHLFYFLWNIPERMLSLMNVGAVGVILSFLFYDKITFRLKDYILVVLWCLALAVVGLYFLSITLRLLLFVLRAHGNEILGGECHYTFQFLGSDGTLETDVHFELRNITFSQLRTVLTDAEGFAKPIKYSPVYHVLKRSNLPDGKVSVVGGAVIPSKEFKDYGGGPTIHQSEWAATIDPPLQPFESVSIVRHSTDVAAEDRAFGDSGTEFIIRCRMPFKKLTATILAPTGYSIKPDKLSVDSQAGHVFSRIVTSSQPKLIGSKTLFWECLYPQKTLRYKIRFKLIELTI